MRPHGRATIDRSFPRALGVCDRCGFLYNHDTLQWQFDWRGPRLQNLRILVCAGCLDVPQENLRTITLPADPVPIMNARPEQYDVEVPSFIMTYNSSAAIATYDSSAALITEIDVVPTPTSSGFSTPNGPYVSSSAP